MQLFLITKLRNKSLSFSLGPTSLSVLLAAVVISGLLIFQAGVNYMMDSTRGSFKTLYAQTAPIWSKEIEVQQKTLNELQESAENGLDALATKLIIEKCIKDKVKHFIYASSGSVYGLKKEKKVNEKLALEPLSTYNKTKMIAERIIESYKDDIKYHIIRPATVCGFSPRMRLDVTVNMFVYQAIKKKCIEVHGGQQIRPNIHIKDLTNVYLHFLKNNNFKSGIYNAGFENLSILDIAKKVSKICKCKLKIVKKFNDQRSYRQNSDKLLSTGFKRKYSVEDAIYELSERFINKTLIPDEICFTVKFMKKKDFK